MNKQEEAAKAAEEYKAELKEAFGFDPDEWRNKEFNLPFSKAINSKPVSFWVDFRLGLPVWQMENLKNSFHFKSEEDEERTD